VEACGRRATRPHFAESHSREHEAYHQDREWRSVLAVYGGCGGSSTVADLRPTKRRTPAETSDASYSPPNVKPYLAPSGVAENAATQGSLDYMSVAIWLITRGVNKIKDHQLELAVAATGGVHYQARRDRTVRSALDQIGGELHAQYKVGYAPGQEACGWIPHD
jgi:hypothetical protein